MQLTVFILILLAIVHVAHASSSSNSTSSKHSVRKSSSSKTSSPKAASPKAASPKDKKPVTPRFERQLSRHNRIADDAARDKHRFDVPDPEAFDDAVLNKCHKRLYWNFYGPDAVWKGAYSHFNGGVRYDEDKHRNTPNPQALNASKLVLRAMSEDYPGNQKLHKALQGVDKALHSPKGGH